MRLKKRLLAVLTVLMTFALATSPLAVFAEGTEVSSSEQSALMGDRDLPVGGVSIEEPICISEDFDVPSYSGGKPSLRSAKGGTVDEVFTEGVSSVGYNSLDDNGKAFYEVIDEAAIGFMRSDTDIEPAEQSKYVFAKINYNECGLESYLDAMTVLYAYDLDHPGDYWLSTGALYSVSNIYLYLCANEEYASAAVRQEINEIVSSGVKRYVEIAENGTDTLDKAAIVHDLIASEIDYAYKSGTHVPEDARWAHNVQGVFDPEYKHAVCEGYADVFALVMNYMGIPNIYLLGEAGSEQNKELHAWNAVSADGGQTYRYVDLTWDDCGSRGYSYEYFGMPASDFEQSHFKSDPLSTSGRWLYDVDEEFTDSFEDTYYYTGGLYYDGSIDAADFGDSVVAKESRVSQVITFLTPNWNTVIEVSNALGIRINDIRTSYKGTEYYYNVVDRAYVHVHDWDDPVYSWADDNSEVTAWHECWAPMCDNDIEEETVATTLEYIKEPTCTEEGTAIFTAEFTNEYFETQTREGTVAALGHDWEPELTDVITEPTCTEPGLQEAECARCHEVVREDIPAAGHQWNSSYTVDKQATYTAVGTKSIHCSICGEKKPGSAVTIAKEVKVDLPKAAILTPVAAKRAATVKWKKVSSRNQKKIASIQIQYSLDKTFKKGVKTTTAKKSAVSKKLTKLTSGKRYYIRIRTYKKAGGVTHVSKWSTVKYVKVK